VKVLINSNPPIGLSAALCPDFSGTIHLRELGFQHAPDILVWDYAAEHGFAIMSKDADFYQLSLVKGHPPKVIWLQIGNEKRRQTVARVQEWVGRISSFLIDEQASLLILS